MTVRIEGTRCNGCGKMKEPRCVAVCPGDLLYKDDTGKCTLRDPKDCWDCAACLKECPHQAIEMFLSVQVGGRGSTLTAQTKRDMVMWQLRRFDGKQETFKIRVRNTIVNKKD